MASGTKIDSGRTSPPRAADSAQRAYAEIRNLAINFKLRPNERVNELQLAKQLDVSRTPVREALNRLASEGFLVLRPNKGYFFRALDIGELVALSEVRSVLEVGGFQLACERADAKGIADLGAFWDEAHARYAAHDVDEILGLDEEFHRRIAALSGNPALVQNLDSIAARIKFTRRIFIERGSHFADLVLDHAALIRALSERNAQEGAQILRRHIGITTEDARSAIKEALIRIYVPDSV